jgi:hypothetical protein
VEGESSECVSVGFVGGGWVSLPFSFSGGIVYLVGGVMLTGKRGDDDCFSSDLGDERLRGIWGNVQSPVLIVPSGADESVPAEVDVPGMVERWKGFCRPGIVSGLSGLIPGANHRVDDATAKEWLADRVGRFVGELGE